MKFVVFVLFAFQQFSISEALVLANLYPFGACNEGETWLRHHDDASSGEIPISMPFPFFGQKYNSVYVSMMHVNVSWLHHLIILVKKIVVGTAYNEGEHPYQSTFFIVTHTTLLKILLINILGLLRRDCEKCPQTSNEGMKINARKYKIIIQFLNVWYPMLPECSYLDSMNIIQ